MGDEENIENSSVKTTTSDEEQSVVEEVHANDNDVLNVDDNDVLNVDDSDELNVDDSDKLNVDDSDELNAVLNIPVIPPIENKDWYSQKEYIMFKNQLESQRRNNLFILKECKDSKRLLDLRYSNLETKITWIQVSVIFGSTMSGFLQATKEYFDVPTSIVTVFGISMSAYISLLLSISKYYKLDECKEKINTLREKYCDLQNKIEYRMDLLGPWTWPKLWEYQDAVKKFKEWTTLVDKLDDEYSNLILTKQSLCTEYENIMDSKSRNIYNIKNKELLYSNRKILFEYHKKEYELEEQIKNNSVMINVSSSIKLPDEDLDNWDDDIM